VKIEGAPFSEISINYIRIYGEDSSNGMATGWTSGVRFLAGQEIFLFSIASGPSVGTTEPPIQYIKGDFCVGVKGPGREADHSPPSSTEAKNGGAIPPFPKRLHAMVLS
jgi:hypothetical protein